MAGPKPHGVIAVLVGLILGALLAPSAWAWSVPTHQLLSQRAAEVSTLNPQILARLGFQDLQTTIRGVDFRGMERTYQIRRWIQDGAGFEDDGTYFDAVAGTARYLNHFHNPLHQRGDLFKPWRNAGLDDYILGVVHVHGQSSVLWAQNKGANDVDTMANPLWSWQGVREAYYQAFTAQAKADREASFARVFAGLGHLIHLIQDMAQPDHVRNDAHPSDDFLKLVSGLEHWARVAEVHNQTISRFAEQPVPPALSLVRAGTTGDGLEPITNFWDTDRYTGITSPTGANGSTFGLAEYTNANYFSKHTINSQDPAHQFPYPSVTLNEYYTCTDEAPPNSLAVRRWYISRTPCPSDGTRPDHFLSQSLLRDIWNQPPETISSASQMDDNVRQDYARDLIPRAVGYSAGLIDYFFRGQLAIEPVDPTHVRVTNRSNETLQSGAVELFAETAAGDRARLPEAHVLTGPIGPGQSTPPIEVPPLAERTAGGYSAVFRGTLGEEENAVIGTSDFQWVEEWDQGLTGRHPWYQTTNDPGEMNALPPGSVVQTTVGDGVLTQENTRPAGTERFRPGPGVWLSFQVNQSYLGLTDFAPPESLYRDIFPLRVTPKTDLVVKVDVMSLSAPVAVPQCPDNTWGNGAYQGVIVEFDNGYFLELTVRDQQRNLIDTYNPIFITLGEETRINLYDALLARGVSVTEPRAVKLVMTVQQFLPPCEPTVEEQSQVLQVDYIRFVEGP